MSVKRQMALVGGLLFFLGISLVAGCGMKRPPLAPLKEGNAVAAPRNLAYTLDGDRVLLTWTHAVDPENARIPPEGFKVFVATKTAEQCEGCPFIFEAAGTVAMPAMQFGYTLAKDLRHYFRVQALGENNRVSSFSKTLYIDRQAE